jgi:hypothetical protein
MTYQVMSPESCKIIEGYCLIRFKGQNLLVGSDRISKSPILW